MKDNFLLKTSQISVFNELSNEDAGKLIKGIFEYAKSGKITLQGYLKIIFIPIKEDIDKNQERYEIICERNRRNGKLGGRPKKSNKTQSNPVGYLETQKNMINHNHNHNHNHNQLNNNIQNKYYDNIELNNLFLEFLDLRKKLKCKNTDRAITLLINKLNEYDDATKIEMINNAIMNSWKSVYPLKENNQKKSAFSEVLEEIENGKITFQ